MCVHAILWAFTQSWLSDFGADEFSSTTVYGLFCFVVCVTVSHGKMGTLRDGFDNYIKRQEAEEGYRRFLSYMMHEMRNPIGGAMFLLDDLEHTNRKLALSTKAAGASREGGGKGGMGFPPYLDSSPPPVRVQSNGKPGGGESAGNNRSSCFLPMKSRNGVRGNGSPDHVGGREEDVAAEKAGLEKEIEFLHGRMRSSLEMMKSVCDDVLTIEKVQKRGFEYFVSTCNPVVWLEELSNLERIAMTAANIDLKLVTEIAPDLENGFETHSLTAAADWLHLRQVAVNFLSNARKFTKKGGEVVLRLQVDRLNPRALPPECRLPDSPEGGGEGRGTGRTLGSGGAWGVPLGGNWEGQGTILLCDVARSSTGLPKARDVTGWARMHVSVSDTGAGLTPAEAEKLFLPYSQIRAGELQRGGGTGLGLCISKMFVEAHWDGKVGVMSEGRNLGSTFFFSICCPLVAIHRERRGSPVTGTGALLPAFPFALSPRGERRQSLAPVSLCLGEPLLDSQGRPSGEGLEGPWGGDGGCAASPRVSVARVASSTPLSNCRSPHLRRSRSSSIVGEGGGTAGTGSSGGVRGQGGHRRSVVDQLLPPALPPAPVSSCARERSDASSAGNHEEDVPAGMPGSMLKQVQTYAGSFDCLVVDDIWICAFGSFRAMERLGFRPCMCLSGMRALERLRKPGAVDRVKVVLMDKDMPGIDGPETIRRLRTFFLEQGVRQPFVVGVTGEAAGPGMAALKEAGADVVFSKPLRPEALQESLQRFMQTQQED
uniref:histidine kinase n=1 Tax=Chromera velia CCMP2878 TaxID=1169474 RepID=A0A0G4HFF0_9ALVE|eukprot:Cvel_6647.t1-p1 / transcript=Cvel_6647.t1 / gene=Cvel_6647 / organism=Chromera_velia_CCMP2878 / gene_product=hypothetical protein / transcript_product=hypothetical protein / location=Cvel_scaffold329:87553-91205(-) / protein_length=768 / sequence_SO=supercontig / SO=protein_coding / is_pseudo=false